VSDAAATFAQPDRDHLDGVAPGLHALPPRALPFDHALEVRAFLLERSAGNLLVYNTGGLTAGVAAIDDLGGVTRQYLNHWHEAILGCERQAGTAPPRLFCHEADRAAATERCEVHESFNGGHMLGDDFEVIPIPGHTPGATAYLWDSGQHRCLFTGDTIYLRDGEWVGALLPSSDRVRYMESLELIRDLDFDVLVPWAATTGQPFRSITGRADARRRIDTILERIWRGGDH
jgi:glyoxylase-like metal-dependent hydrolase (beta-lactamase superfamily II)